MIADVLIVGGGSAGSVLAERLSADSRCAVTLLEAGPGFDDTAMRALTEDAATLPIGPDSPVACHYRSTLTERPPRPADLVRGSCLGGSGAVNGGYFCRALPGDLPALPGWSQAEIAEHFDAVEARIGVRPADGFANGTAAFVAAALHAGYRRLPDLRVDGTGVGPVPLNIADGVRVGPGLAFLAPALGRPNLTVLTRTRVTRIRVVAGRVSGVEGVGPDGPVTLTAGRVVLCAGAIATAQLLMLSGIGPAGRSATLGVPVVADLPVGQRCWDHPEWTVPTRWPAAAGHPVLEAVLVTAGLEIRPYTTGFGSPTTSVGVALMRPRSRGRVVLASADPAVPPDIAHRYDTEPSDLADLRHGRNLVEDLLAGAADAGEPVWSTSQHLGGTAPMGTVVDPRCRVLGVDGLSVVDGSVLAEPPGRGPHATIAMLAHRAAEFF